MAQVQDDVTQDPARHRGLRALLLPLYLDLYDEIDPDLRDRFRGFIDRVSELLGNLQVDFVTADIITAEAQLQRAMESLRGKEPDLLITLHLSYSPSLLVSETLAALSIPILILDTTTSATFDGDDDSYLMMNHGIHGVMDLTSVLKARGVDYHVVAGHLSDPAFAEKLRAYLDGCTVAMRFRNQTIGITGTPFAGMGDFAVDFAELERDYGIRVVEIGVEELAAAGRAIPGERVRDGMEEDAKSFDMGDAPVAAHEEAVRTYLALADAVRLQGLSGYTMNFQHIDDRIAVPFYACSRLMGEGIGYAGEGDVLTASFGGALASLDRRVMFNEMFCADWQRDTVLMAHMGETDLRFCKPGERPRAETRPAIGNPRDSVIFHFPKEPMPVTVMNVAKDGDSRFRLIVFSADIVDAPVYVSVQAPHFLMKPPLPIAEFLERYAEAGGGHHLYIAEGDLIRQTRIAASSLGWAYAQVG